MTTCRLFILLFVFSILFSGEVLAQAQKKIPILQSAKAAGRYSLITRWGQDKGPNKSIDLVINPDGSWDMTVRIGFWGANLFINTPTAEQDKVIKRYASDPDTKFAPEKSFFKKENFIKNGVISLGNHPKISEIIEQQMETASRFLSASKSEIGLDLRVTVVPVFIDETELYKKLGIKKSTGTIDSKITDSFVIGKLDYHPITVYPIPDPNVVTPDFWDIYARPEYITHEIVHLLTLSTGNDEFSFVDAPFDGLTNEGPTYRKLEELGFEPKMDPYLFGGIVSSQPTLVKIFATPKTAFDNVNVPFKLYMDLDEKGKYSDSPEVYKKNLERKYQMFLKSDLPKRRR